MVGGYLKSIFRNLITNLRLNAINTFGFAMGMASCIIIGHYVAEESSYDTHNKNADRIYRVYLDRVYPARHVEWAAIPPAVRDGLVAEFPEVEEATRIFSVHAGIRPGDRKESDEINAVLVDPSFGQIFTVPVLEGSLTQTLKAKDGIAISESLATRYFKGRSAIGQVITVEHRGPFIVQAVIANCPRNTHFHYEAVLPLLSAGDDLSIWDSNFGYYTYVLLKRGTSPAVFEAKLPAMSRKYLSGADPKHYERWRSEGNDYKFRVQSLLAIHLQSNFKWELEPNGNATYVYLFSAVGVLVLLIAIINFMNLSTARYSSRAREIGIRKVLGSNRSQLIGQYLLESMILAVVSLGAAIAIVVFVAPILSALVGHSLLVDFKTWTTLGVLFGFTLLTGVLAGLYPAFLFSGFKVTQSINSNSSSLKVRPGFRNALIVTQFAISFFLIVATLAVFTQMQFMMEKNLGFNRENVLVVDKVQSLEAKKALRNELASNTHIVDVAFSSEIPGRMSGASTFKSKDGQSADVNMTTLYGDEQVLSTWGMELLGGRNFIPQDYMDTVRNVILNETAVRQLDLGEEPIGKYIINQGNRPLSVVGVVRDFHIESLEKEIRPLVFLPITDWTSKMCIRLRGDNVSSTVSFIKAKWREFAPDRPFEYFFLDDYYKTLYDAEQVTEALLILFSSMALMISALGLFGLSSFMAEQRTREIGIRKVMGSTVFGIMMLFLRSNLRLIMVSSLIAAPSAWFATMLWLDRFAYRTNVPWWPYPVAFSITLIIASVTVLSQSYRAARTNPAHSLRAS